MSKKRLFFVILIITITGVYGCMGTGMDYKKAILSYLREKYDCDFEVKQITKEFNGFDGNYLRAVCNSITNHETFEVYCYMDDEKNGDAITINQKKYVILDNYVNVLFGNQLESILQDKIGAEIFLKCEVTFSDHFVTKEEYKAGMQDCMNNKELYSHVTVYAIAENETILKSIRQKVEEACLNLNAYRQYLYFAVASDKNVSDIQEHYDKNEGTFDQHINECGLIKKVFFTLLKRDEGITNKTVERM